MKYTIFSFQQAKLIESKLNLEEALVLQVLLDMSTKTTTEFIFENNIKKMWVNVSNINKHIPILGTKRNLIRKLESLEKKKFIVRHTRYERKGKKGTYLYIQFTRRTDSISEYSEHISEKVENELETQREKYKNIKKKYKLKIRKNSKKNTPEAGYDKSVIGGYDKSVIPKYNLSKDSSKEQQQQLENNSSQKNEKKKNNNKDNNKKNESQKEKEIIIEKVKGIEEYENITVDKIETIENTTKNINKKIGIIKKEIVLDLIKEFGSEKVNFYINNFKAFKINKHNPVGFFINAIKNNYDIPKEQKNVYNGNKPIQSNNFDQREYDDEFYDSLYEN